jgi:hypothetical protein
MQNFLCHYNDIIFIKYQSYLLYNKTLIIQLTHYTIWGQWDVKQICHKFWPPLESYKFKI